MLRINATPLRPGDGSQLAEEVLEALRQTPSAGAADDGVAQRIASERSVSAAQ